MPPLRSERASRACDSCRRLKTRCYPSKYRIGSCLRCETQNQHCSLKNTSRQNDHTRRHDVSIEVSDRLASPSATRVEERYQRQKASLRQARTYLLRLAKLETVVHKLVDQLDLMTRQTSAPSNSRRTSSIRTQSTPSANEHDAPMFLIKGIAEDVRAGHRETSNVPDDNTDPVANRMIGMEDAFELLILFRLHYGRWVNFDESISIEQLMTRVRGSSLLFYSICLVAARHTTRRHINVLAPTFFREAKRLLQASLLTTPQPLEFFQAALLLSLWSTTIGQVPLSIDSWLLTSYTLQQGLTSAMATSVKEKPVDDHRLRACCTWNHICLSHLQYCVGTGRKPLLQEAQVERCADVLEFEISQFEVRMVAELKLYWIIVSRCCVTSVNLSTIRAVLQTWRKDWLFLFNQPRAQFLEMGYNFAMLIAYCRSLHSKTSKLSHVKLSEMIQHARDIISVAKAHTDERTPHLTDHIYHIITFSAITLCQLITKYPNVLVEPNTAASLQHVILGLVDWLRSIGTASHVSHVLANIIAAHYADCTTLENLNTSQSANRDAVHPLNMPPSSNIQSAAIDSLQNNADNAAVNYSFQDLAWTTFFDFNADTLSWPQLVGSGYTPTNESWTTSTHEVTP